MILEDENQEEYKFTSDTRDEKDSPSMRQRAFKPIRKSNEYYNGIQNEKMTRLNMSRNSLLSNQRSRNEYK